MTPTCDKSPTGQHCPHLTHDYVGAYTTCPTYKTVCCHCGQSDKDGHGPYHPGHGTITYGDTNTTNAISLKLNDWK